MGMTAKVTSNVTKRLSRFISGLTLMVVLVSGTACSSPAEASFVLSIEPSFVTMTYEAETSLQLSVTRTNLRSDEPILVELIDPPPGFAAAPITIIGNTGTFTIRAQSPASPGDYILGLRASGPDLNFVDDVSVQAVLTF